MSHRTFVAVDVDDATRAALARVGGRLDRPGMKVNWVTPENLHLTLAFLGDVADEDLATVCAAARDVVAGAGPVAFEVRGVQVVPPSRGPVRMLWANVPVGVDALADLAGRLADAFEPLGFPPDRREFRAHLTLARVKWLPDLRAFRAAAEALADEPFGHVTADAVTVYTSQLTKAGPIYASASRCAL